MLVVYVTIIYYIINIDIQIQYKKIEQRLQARILNFKLVKY